MLSVGVVLVTVFVAILGVYFVLSMVRGGEKQVYFNGQYWDRDVYRSAMNDVRDAKRSRGLVDAESLRALKAWDRQ